MSTLAEIEAATEALSVPEKEALFRFLAVRLGGSAAPPHERRAIEDGKRFNAVTHRAWLKRTWGERRFTEEEVREMRAAQG